MSTDDNTRERETGTSWRDRAVEFGMKFARHVFQRRGNNSEAHVTEAELAAMMAESFERGACRAITQAAIEEAREGKAERFSTMDELLTDLRAEPESTVKLTARESMQMLDMMEHPQPRSAKFMEAMARYKGQQWLSENAEAIQSSNEYVEQRGLPLAKYRMPSKDEEGEHGDE